MSNSLLESQALETGTCRYGIMTYLKNDSLIGRSLREYGEWAQVEIDFLLGLIENGNTVIDIGAFIGTHTLAFAQRVGKSGGVLAFEPQSSIFKLLNINIEQNALTNIKTYNVALSDTAGTTEILESNFTILNNPGSFSLNSLADINPLESEKVTVNLTTLDAYSIDKCDLIKIDVEGMEYQVLKGASETIRRFQPIVFAECLSVDNGWQVFSLMRLKGYTAFLHNELSYNPNNFKNNASNFLYDGRETNLVFIPGSRLSSLKDSNKNFINLIPLNSVDDLALGMLKKPQYKYEVLAKTEASKVIGINFLLNEPEIKNLTNNVSSLEQMVQSLKNDAQEKDSQIEQLNSNLKGNVNQINELNILLAAKNNQTDDLNKRLRSEEQQNIIIENDLKNRDKQIKALSSNLEEKDRQNIELNHAIQITDTEINQLKTQMQQSITLQIQAKYQRIIEKLLPLKSRRRHLYELKLSAIRILLNQGLRSLITKTANYVGLKKKKPGEKGNNSNTLKPSAEGTTSNIPGDSFHWNLDYLRKSEKRIYGWGWLFDEKREISELTFCLFADSKQYNFSCQYGITRPDIFNQFKTGTSKNSGFVISCFIDSARISKYGLQVKYSDGDSDNIAVNQDMIVVSNTSQRNNKLWRQWIKAGWHLLLQGKIKVLFLKIGQKIGEIFRRRRVTRLDFLQYIENQKRFDQSNVSIIIDHNMGGGANLYRNKYISKEIESQNHTFLLYYDLPSLSYHIRLFGKDKEEEFIPKSIDVFVEALIKLKPREIFLNNVVSYENPLYIASLLPVLKKKTSARIIVALHDYFFICPSYTLIDDTGKYCGVPDISRCQKCLLQNHGDFSFLVDNKDIKLWRRTWSLGLNCADSILCFSQSSKDILCRAYPELDPARMQVHPHSVEDMKSRIIHLKYDWLNIGVVGKISNFKGASILNQIASIIRENNLPIKITIIGELEGTNSVPSVIKTTGPYSREKLPELIQNSDANIFLFPSIWPETFSYVTEELMKLDLPLAVFNLGAPAERVARYNRGIIIQEIDAKCALDTIIRFFETFANSNVKNTKVN